MKRCLAILALSLTALLSAPFCRAADGDEDLTLQTGKRVNTMLHVVLPAYAGAAVIPDSFGLHLGLEALGVRFTSRGSGLEGDAGLRFTWINFFRQDNGNVSAPYLGIPVRAAYRFNRWWKVYAGVSGDVLLGNSALNRYRASVEGGLSWHGFGLWASYGLTPFHQPSDSPAGTVSFGLVFGL
jgi:hypothetical protein